MNISNGSSNDNNVMKILMCVCENEKILVM